MDPTNSIKLEKRRTNIKEIVYRPALFAERVKGSTAREAEGRRDDTRLPQQGCEAYVSTGVYADRTDY